VAVLALAAVVGALASSVAGSAIIGLPWTVTVEEAAAFESPAAGADCGVPTYATGLPDAGDARRLSALTCCAA